MKRKKRNLLRGLIPLLSISLFSGCASVDEWIAKGQPYTGQINWPERYKPEDATFFIHNRIEIEAPPEVIWEELIQAELWPEWYEGAENVQITSSEGSNLEADSIFTWRTMDLNFTSTIEEFEPPYRLSWESRKSSIQGYHAWLIVPTEDGAIVVTDESQTGWLAVLQGIFVPNKLHRLHDIWLAELKARAEARHAADL